MNLFCGFCCQTPVNIVECDYCGLPYCYDCSLNNKCISCDRTSFSISKFGLLLVKNMLIKCKNCLVQIPACIIDKHLTDCKLQTMKCKIRDCELEIRKNKLTEHLVTDHEDNLLKFIEKGEQLASSLAGLKIQDALSMIDYPNEFLGAWPNNSKVFIHQVNNFLTFSSQHQIADFCSCKIFIKNALSVGHVVLGLSSKVLNIKKGYLGGDFGEGNWGLAGNGCLGEEGVWKKGCSYKQGDIIELIFKQGWITYSINGNLIDYSYKLKKNVSTVYLSATAYYKNTCLVII